MWNVFYPSVWIAFWDKLLRVLKLFALMMGLPTVVVDRGRLCHGAPQYQGSSSGKCWFGTRRNTGIEHSTGSYIAFVDSDDWIVPEIYSNLIETAYRTNADIVVSGHCDATEDAILLKKVHPLAGKVLDSAEKIAEMRLNLFGHGLHDSVVEAFPMSSCMSIYSRDLIKGNSSVFKTSYQRISFSIFMLIRLRM